MANELGTASGELSLDAQKFQKSIQDANASLDRFDAQWKKTVGASSGQQIGGDPGQIAAKGAAWRDLGNKIDGAGRQAMIGMRSMSDVASLAGMNREMTMGITAAAGMADAIGDLSGVLTMTNPVLLAVAAAGALIAFVFSRIQAEAQEQANKIAALRKPFQELREEIVALVNLKGISGFAKELGVSEDALRGYITNVKGAADGTLNLAFQTEEFKVRAEKIKIVTTEIERYKKIIENARALGLSTPSALASIDVNTRKVEELEKELGGLISKQGHAQFASKKLTDEIIAGADAFRVQQIQLEEQTKAQERFTSLASQFGKARIEAERRNVDIESNLAERRVEINSDADDRIVDIRRNLGTTLAGMQRDYIKQVASFAREEQRIHADAAKAIQSLERDTAKQIAQIDRDAARSIAKVNQDEAKSLADVDNNLRKTIRNARSARDRREARREAAERKTEITAQANERRNEIAQQAAERKAEIAERKTERLAEIAEQKAERLADLAEKRKLAAEEFAFRKAEATRVANEQIAAARKAADEQIKAAERAAQKQKEAQQRALDEMEAELRKTAADAGMMGYSIGQQTGAGIAKGISDSQAATRDAAIKAAMDAFNAMKKILGISSPSKLFENKIGKPMAQGVLVGFNRTMDNSARQMSLNFSHTWTGTSVAQFDRASIQRVAEDAAFRGVRLALDGAA